MATSDVAPQAPPTVVTAPSDTQARPAEVQPAITAGAPDARTPDYLTDGDLAILRRFSLTSKSFGGQVVLPSEEPAALAEGQPLVLAQTAEVGDLSTVVFSSPYGAPLPGLEEYVGGVSLSLIVTPLTEAVQEQIDAMETRTFALGRAVFKVGADASRCDAVPEDGYDATTLIGAVDGLLISVETLPLVGCEKSPIEFDDVVKMVANLELCSFEKEAIICRTLLD